LAFHFWLSEKVIPIIEGARLKLAGGGPQGECMNKVIIGVLCLIFASAAAAAEPQAQAPKGVSKKKPAPAAPDTRKTIGLISEIGDKFTVQQIGIMIFGNQKREEPIESWGMDAFVAAKFSNAVKARFNAVPIALSPEGKAALAKAPGWLFGDRGGYICNLLQKETKGRVFNYYVRVRPREKPYSNTNQFVGGLGIVHRQGFDTGYTFVHALFDIEVLDGGNCSSVRSLEPPSTQGFLFAEIHGPAREVEASWIPAASVASDARLKETTQSLVESGLIQTIPQLFATD
jgi:hypothetical protein